MEGITAGVDWVFEFLMYVVLTGCTTGAGRHRSSVAVQLLAWGGYCLLLSNK